MQGVCARRALIGCLAAKYFWWIAIPVGVIVWLFGLKGPFGDYMLTHGDSLLSGITAARKLDRSVGQALSQDRLECNG